MAKEKEELKKKKSESKKDSTKKKNKEKTNIFTKLSNFLNGVKIEFKRIKWPSKKDMIKYSVATIIFIVVCAVFFYLIDIILAALHSLGK